jgi:hypothetical protein
MDWRNLENGRVIPDEGYCDQPYVIITRDGNWLCTLTTGRGIEGQNGQHVVATISSDRGKTWSRLIDIEPADGPVASWAMPLVTPSGRVYVFYDYNGDRVDTLGTRKGIRADMLGWYVFKYSDDNGRTWSAQRYRLPVRPTAMDAENDWGGRVQMFWGIGKPIIHNGAVYLGFAKIGKYLIDRSEGWFFRSDNLLQVQDPTEARWEMLPDGDIGLRSPAGPIAEEHNLVGLSDGTLFCVYRTIDGHPCHAWSRDGGRHWTPPAYADYVPGGPLLKHPRACPRLWKTKTGRYLLWFHNQGLQGFEGRNPAWLTGGVEKEGRIWWSQPEIVLYDSAPATRTSYPDLVEENGRYWITETQKSVARVHEIDPGLLEGLWAQSSAGRVDTRGLLASATGDRVGARAIGPALRWPILGEGTGATIEMWLRLDDVSAGQVLLDSRNAAGKGILLGTAAGGSVRLELAGDDTGAFWESDPGSLRAGRLQHLVAVVEGGPGIICFVVDGRLCDGGTTRPFGWGRFGAGLTDINGGDIRLGQPRRGQISTVRLFGRPLRISEAVSHFRAGA